ncbi:MAG: energy-coupling factor transporter transmembrane component T [Nitrospinota bacterium]
MITSPRPAARDPRFLAGCLLSLGLLAVALDSLVSLALLAAIGLAWALAARPGPRQLLLLAAALGLSAWSLMLSQALFYDQLPRTVLIVLVPPEAPIIGRLTGGLSVYREGILHGAVQSLRLVAVLSAGLAAAWTLEPSGLLAGFASLRLPHALAFCGTAAVRFLPVTAEEARVALRAQRMRGLRLGGRGGANALRALFAIARPVLAAAIRRAETAALAAASRGYDPARRRTSLRPLRMAGWERAVLLLALLAAGGVAAAKALYLLYASGLYYHPALAALYTFTREAL